MYPAPFNEKELEPGDHGQFLSMGASDGEVECLIRLNPGSKIFQRSLLLFALNRSQYLSDGSWLHGCLILGKEELWIWVTNPLV